MLRSTYGEGRFFGCVSHILVSPPKNCQTNLITHDDFEVSISPAERAL